MRMVRSCFVLLLPLLSVASARADGVHLDAPSIGQIDIEPNRHVITQSAPFLGLPASTAHVRSTGEVHLSTAAHGVWPSTRTQITRLFEIRSSIGNRTYRITPFRITRAR